MKLAAITYLVRDYDEAIAWFTSALNFELLEDTKLDDEKRWVRVAVPNAETCLLLAKAQGEQQVSAIGKAAGGRVAYFLYTDDFQKTHRAMLAAGVTFREEPRSMPYGKVAVFDDLYGNGWDLIEPK